MEEDNGAVDSGATTGGPLVGFPSPPPPIYRCTLTPALEAKAREELQEKPEWRLRDAQALRDMVQKEQPNLRTRLDDAFLLRFLRARKFDYDRGLQLLLNYHASRRAWPEVFHDLRPSTVRHVLEQGFITVLPQPDSQGRYILCLRPGKWKQNDYPFVDNIRAIYLTLEKLIQPEETQVNGIVILVDYTGVGLSQASNPGPFLAKKVVSILQDGFPIRIKAVNIINEPRIFKGIFAIIKPFLKEKMAERYVLHGSDLASLHRNIPRAVLPEEYGGVAGRLDFAVWTRTLLDSEEDFAVEFCQPDPLEGAVPPDAMLFEGEAGSQADETFRNLRSQLYYCY
ncbi:alpha-tocopherol transfer protein-like [Denticeps clupeoides]|uniref:CRAL-TRIO domain-containing protein n=2 Tax=Denticeps clupeoides TaxID=299321 RepID=A0AAY4AT80_9TELE|nr:alpha-tocopherol transfer protein-like [Denticeps clupeoides]XP_028850002.1 alpha-tocopherol transfer protein-like [Denticeps clupeoides]